MDNKYYELHVTVQPDDVLAFLAFCAKVKTKPLYIQLNQGTHQDQLMLAQTHMLQDDKIAKGWAGDYTNTMKRGFNVLRTKLESRLTEGPNEYYEAHWKLDFSRNEYYWECTLSNLVKLHPQLHRSHNLLNTRIHYLSQRIYCTTDPLAASEQFAASGETIKGYYDLPLVKTHYERCVWDSNPALDFGWA